MRLHLRGGWEKLLAEAAATTTNRAGRPTTPPTEAEKAERRRTAAAGKVRLREVGRARQVLTSNGLAPGTAATLRELTDETLRPRELTAPLPEGVASCDVSSAAGRVTIWR